MERAAGISSATGLVRTVLMVEDEVLIRMAAAEALREHGFIVVEASNAADAEDLIASGIAPEVLFTDVRMPGGIDGLELAQRIQSRLPRLIVMIASGHADPQAAAARGFRFFSKPYDIIAVVDAIKKDLDQSER